MKKYLLVNSLLGLVFINLSCSCKKNNINELSKSSISRPIYPIIKAIKDTVVNGSTYKATFYLSNDSLYKIGISNGIRNYLIMKYENNLSSDEIVNSTKIPYVNHDTAYAEFQVLLPTLSKDSIKLVYWLAEAGVDFTKQHNGVDTTFLSQGIIYVKGR